MKNEIKKTWFFKQSPEEVWEYLTTPALLEQWLMKNNFKPVTGHKFQFTFEAKEGSKYDGVVDCEVVELVPFSRLVYTWNGGTMDKRKFNSRVEWVLVPKNKGTELQLSHDGFTVLEDVLNHSGGWENCIKRMEEHFNTKKNEYTQP